MGRDDQTDAGRMGAPSRTKAEMAQATIDMAAATEAEDRAARGWPPNQKPAGGEPVDNTWPPDRD